GAEGVLCERPERGEPEDAARWRMVGGRRRIGETSGHRSEPYRERLPLAGRRVEQAGFAGGVGVPNVLLEGKRPPTATMEEELEGGGGHASLPSTAKSAGVQREISIFSGGRRFPVRNLDSAPGSRDAR